MLRVLTVLVAAASVAGCVLPDPVDLDFVTSAFATDGELVDELDFNPVWEADGYNDCQLAFDLDGRTDEPEAGCPGCDAEMVVDLVVDSDDCDRIPSGADSSILGLSIGVNGDRAYFHDGSSWVQWLIGEKDGQSYEGSTQWIPQDGGGWQLRESFSLTWVAPE